MEKRRSQEFGESGSVTRQNSGGLDPFLRATGHSSLEAPLLGLATNLKVPGGGSVSGAGSFLGAIASPFTSFAKRDEENVTPLPSPMLGPSAPLGALLPDMGPLASPLLGLACAPGGSFSGTGKDALGGGSLQSTPDMVPVRSWDQRRPLEAVPERDSDGGSTGSGQMLSQRDLSGTSGSGFTMRVNVLPPRADRPGSSLGGAGVSTTAAGGASQGGEDYGFIAQSKEWHCLSSGGDSEGEEEAPQGPMERRMRYMNAVPENAELAVNVSAKPATPVESVDANVMRCWAWIFNFVEMFFGTASIVVLSAARAWLYVGMLLPFHLLLVCLELYGVRHDPGIETLRGHVRRRSSALLRSLALIVLELAIMILCGFFCLFPLVRARRCWRQAGRGAKLRFIDEIEGTAGDGPGGGPTPSARLDSHIMFLTGVPRMVVLTNVLARTGSFTQDDAFGTTLSSTVLIMTVVISLLSVVLAVVHFDYYASQWVRRQYEVAQRCGFQASHTLYRTFEVAGRVLILVAITEVFNWHLALGLAILLVDYLLGIFALLRVTDFVPGSLKMMLVLSVSIYVADVCRYIDEPGLTRQARKVSHFCQRVRFVEVVLALALYGHFAKEHQQLENGLKGAGAINLAVMTVVIYTVCLVMTKCTRIGYRGADLFVICKDRKATAHEVEELLQHGGCDVNLPQMDHTRETALHIAAARGKADSVTVLLLHGADPTRSDSEDETPLHRACRAGHAKVIESLMQPPANSPCAVGGTYQAAAVMENRNHQTPLDLLPADAPQHCRDLLIEAQRAERYICLGNVEAPKAGPERSPAAAAPAAPAAPVARSSTTELSHSFFGNIVSGTKNRLSHSAQGKGLAGFMFSKGIGDQLTEVMDRMQDSRHGVKFSSLRIEGGVLGSGSFGKVFKVKDTTTDELYALKLQRRDKTAKIAVREVQALLQSAHAFIVRLVHMFQTDTYYVLLMELCDKNLNARILEYSGDKARSPGLPEEVTARYTACITLALEYLHSLKIVFRDVKPENILVTFKEKGDFAKLTDFGLARTINDFDSGAGFEGGDSPESAGSGAALGPLGQLSPPRYAMSSVVCGTPRFMAEEVYETTAPAHAADSPEGWVKWHTSRDWYALGLTLLLMLLGDDGGARVDHGGRHVLLPPANQREVWMKMRNIANSRQARGLPVPNDEALELVVKLTLPVADRAGAGELRSSYFFSAAIREMEKEVERYDAEMQEEERKSRASGSISPIRRRAGSGGSSGAASKPAPSFHLGPEAPARSERPQLRHMRTRSAPLNPVHSVSPVDPFG